MIYLIRHGLDDERFIGGWSKGSLIYKGKQQVSDAITFLKEKDIYFNQIFSSDLGRTRETAEIIQKEFDVQLILDSKLREQNKGDYNGVFEIKAKLDNPEFFKNITTSTIYPNGESLLEFNERIRINLPYFLEHDNSLIVTHRGVINALYYQLENKVIDMNKNQFGVTHASIHEYNPSNKTLRKIY